MNWLMKSVVSAARTSTQKRVGFGQEKTGEHMIENVIGMALLMSLGVNIIIVVLIGFLYYTETQDD